MEHLYQKYGISVLLHECSKLVSCLNYTVLLYFNNNFWNDNLSLKASFINFERFDSIENCAMFTVFQQTTTAICQNILENVMWINQ